MTQQDIKGNEELEKILSDLSEQEKIDFFKKMGGVLYQKIFLHALEILSDDKKNELENKMSSDSFSEENLLDFLKQEIPTFEEIVEEETKKTSADFVSLLKAK